MNASSADGAALWAELSRLPPPRQLERLRDEPHAASALMALGDEAERLALVSVGEAVSAGELAVRAADAFGGARERARCRRALAQGLAYAARYEESLALSRQAAKIASEGGEPVEEARALAISLHPLGELGRYDEAISAGERAREALLSVGEPRLAARADFNLGVIHQNRDDPAQALRHFDRARPAFRDDPVITGYLESNRGEALLLLDDFRAAQQAFADALAACQQAGVHVAAAIAEGNLADLATRQGRLDRALFHFEHARRRLESVEAPGHLSRLLSEHAEALDTLGLTEPALRAYESVLPQLDAHGLAWEAARARAGMGRCLLRLNRLDDADRSLIGAAEGFARLTHEGAAARVRLLRAEIAMARGQLDEAESLLGAARPSLGERPMDAAATGYIEARLLAARGQLPIALHVAGESLRRAREHDIPPLIADLAHLRGHLLREVGQAESARQHFELAVSEVERVRGTLQAEHLRAAYLSRRSGMYEDLARAVLDDPAACGAERALTVIEQAKSRSMLDAVAGAVDLSAAGDDEHDDDLVNRATRLRSELNVLYARLADLRPDGRSRVALDRWRRAVRERENELSGIETRLATARGLTSLYAPPARVERVRAALPDDAALLEYFIAGDELLALVATRSALRTFRGLARLEPLRELVQRLRFQLHRAARPGAGPASDRLLRDVRRELHALWQATLAPLAGALSEVRRLLIVPHGPLHVAPMHALWDGERHLVETHEIAYAPSASCFVYLHEAARDGARGDPRRVEVIGWADDAAPAIDTELRRVGDLFAVTPLSGPGATVAAARDRVVAADVLHCASHGQFSARLPMSSGLKLSDGWLTVRDIYTLRMRADLVVLSGCNTGRNLVSAGDELVGLVRGFIVAGARSLLVSLWPAHDENTSNLMLEFHRMWRHSADESWAKAAAVRSAQLAAMRTRPHPLYWAPFVLVGKP